MIWFLCFCGVSCAQVFTLYTGSGRNTWRFGKTVLSGTVGVGKLSLSVLLAKLNFSCHGELVCRASGFCCGDVFKKQRFCLDSEDISLALQYPTERVSLVAILLPLRISQEQGVRKETKDSGGFETEHQGRSGSNFSPTCWNEWYRTSRNAWGNVLTTRDATSQTLYSGSECCN